VPGADELAAARFRPVRHDHVRALQLVPVGVVLGCNPGVLPLLRVDAALVAE